MSESLTALEAVAVTASSGNVISRNPNASVTLGSGATLGRLIVWGGKDGTPFPHYATMKAPIGAASDHAAIYADISCRSRN